ncbi:acyltransferase [Tuberibacillus sp. Marseille-P3662]|uniref:acyltransferase n=1 Tax=Tuberibacillus sp. Marseille-P3662 TaxID=1965358 RepID=UPI000A1CECD7|nr:acyltransferase [Tuberibacillus sp. Marseille-P3662]
MALRKFHRLRLMIGKILFFIDNNYKAFLSYFLSHYYKEKVNKVGQGVRFNGKSKLTGMNHIEIEDNVHIGDNAFIRGEGGLFIGENTHIARNLVLYTHSHNYEGEALPYDNSFRFRDVIIEKNVWIGINVTIAPGTHIKEGAIIGAGSVVHGVIEKMGIYGASGPNLLRQRDQEHYEKLDRERRYGGMNGVPLPAKGIGEVQRVSNVSKSSKEEG